jgi:hypothetical protein
MDQDFTLADIPSANLLQQASEITRPNFRLQFTSSH